MRMSRYYILIIATILFSIPLLANKSGRDSTTLVINSPKKSIIVQADSLTKEVSAFGLRFLLDSVPLNLPINKKLVYIPLSRVKIPSSFKGVKNNQLNDPDSSLVPFFKEMAYNKLGYGDTLRILHIGDSHIKGHIFPQVAGDMFKSVLPLVKYDDLGINGATTEKFSNEDMMNKIASYQPHLIIVSFGTNESYNRSYNSSIHYQSMSKLISMIRNKMPNSCLLLTTPPGNYEKRRIRRRVYSYNVNPRDIRAVNTINKFAKDEKIAVWDMYNILGGQANASSNWFKANLMRNDRVHFLLEGYVLQGELLYQAIIKAYDEYIEHK